MIKKVACFIALCFIWFGVSYAYPILIFALFTVFSISILKQNYEQANVSNNSNMNENEYVERTVDNSCENVQQTYAEMDSETKKKIIVKSAIVGMIGTLFVVGVLFILKTLLIWGSNEISFLNVSLMVDLIKNPMRVRFWFAIIMSCITVAFMCNPNLFKNFIDYMRGANL